MKKYFIKTFGCQMNYSDSERIAAVLERRGFRPAGDVKSANLVVFNTCGVRQMAEDRVYGQIHNLKTHNVKRITIILTGCLADRKDVQRRLKNRVDLFCGIKEFSKEFTKLVIPSEPQRVEGSNSKNSELDSSATLRSGRNDINYLSIYPKHQSKFSAFVPIMTGCDNFCSYCVVPYARGREVSRPAGEIEKEIRDLVKRGYKMITLLGQNVNSYKSEIRIPKSETNSNGLRVTGYELRVTNFSQLLQKINKIHGNFWLTFLTSHPKDMSQELIETIARSKKVLEFVHLPIQTGDDDVLKRMNRKYTRAHYLKLVTKIKKAFAKHKQGKLYAIAGDIIVGFPGETKKQFLKSAEVMEKVKYDMVYFGQFSPRPGTAAAKMKDNVSKKEKGRRENYLNDILKKTAFANNQKYLGKTLDVLIESEKNGFYFGKTRTLKNIKIPADKKNLIGKIVKVKIIKVNVWNLEGICHPTGGRP